jgi:hypothetical protein
MPNRDGSALRIPQLVVTECQQFADALTAAPTGRPATSLNSELMLDSYRKIKEQEVTPWPKITQQ